MIALITSRNTKGYDIVVFNPETNKGKGIQVKCTDRKDFPVASTFLKGMDEELHKKIVCDFVFVDISSDCPKFFILSREEVCKKITESIGRWLVGAKHRKSIEQLEQSNKMIPHTIELTEIMEFEGKWDKILSDLQ